MATYQDALGHIPEVALTDSTYSPSRVTSPTLPGSIDSLQNPMKAALVPPSSLTGTPPVSAQGNTPAPIQPPTPVTPPANIPVPGTAPGAAPASAPPAYTADQVSQLVTSLQNDYGLNFGTGWKDQLTLDPTGFLNKIEALGGLPWFDKGGHIGTAVQAWKKRISDSTVTPPDFTAQRNSIFNEAQGRIEQGTAAGGRAGEEALLSGLASRGLLDSGIGAKSLTDFQTARAQTASQALSLLNQQLTQGALDTSSAAYLDRLMAELNLSNQMTLLEKQAALQKMSQPSPWWGIAGSGIGALGAILSPKAPGVAGVGGEVTPPGSAVNAPPTNPRVNSHIPDPYGLSR